MVLTRPTAIASGCSAGPDDLQSFWEKSSNESAVVVAHGDERRGRDDEGDARDVRRIVRLAHHARME